MFPGKSLLGIYRICAVLSLPYFISLLSFQSPSVRQVPRQVQQVKVFAIVMEIQVGSYWGRAGVWEWPLLAALDAYGHSH